MSQALAIQKMDDACPCGSTVPLMEVFHTETRRYVRCPACDLVFLYPRPTPETVEGYFREEYDGAYGEVEASDHRHPVFESVLDHLLLHRRPPGTLLDIGCGDGGFLTLCRQAGWNCVGVELSRRAAARASKKGFTLLPSQALERGQGIGQFDVVTLINVLETVTNPLTMLRQTAGVLSHDGLVVVRATNGSFHLSMRAPARWVGSQHEQAFHWYLYTVKAMRSLMDLAGLQVVGVRNSRLSQGPLSPTHPWISQLKWTVSRGVLWPISQGAYTLSGGRLVWSPSFEMVARPRRGER